MQTTYVLAEPHGGPLDGHVIQVPGSPSAGSGDRKGGGDDGDRGEALVLDSLRSPAIIAIGRPAA
jgi:hypothetical protein